MQLECARLVEALQYRNRRGLKSARRLYGGGEGSPLSGDGKIGRSGANSGRSANVCAHTRAQRFCATQSSQAHR